MSSGKSNCEISQQIEGFDVFSGVIGNVEFQGIRGIRNDDSTVLKEKDGEGTKMMMEQDKKACYIGVDIGGTKCSVVYGNSEGEIFQKKIFATTNVKENLQEEKESIHGFGTAQAIGVSCGGPLDSQKGQILSPPNLPGWDQIPIADLLREEFGIPVFLKNDADACALAEWKLGAGKGAKNMAFFTFGTGMGAGLILNGELYTGACDMAGEIGHVRMANYGPVGYGKEGSFEGFCSGGGIAQLGMMKARKLFQQGKKVSFCKNINELSSITAKEIAEYANKGNKDAMEVYQQCGKMLGQGLAVLIDLLNPERIILGSVYVRSKELLLDTMWEVLQRECLPKSLECCQILPSGLGEKLGDVAALTVAAYGMDREKKQGINLWMTYCHDIRNWRNARALSRRRWNFCLLFIRIMERYLSAEMGEAQPTANIS